MVAKTGLVVCFVQMSLYDRWKFEQSGAQILLFGVLHNELMRIFYVLFNLVTIRLSNNKTETKTDIRAM